MAKIAAFGAEKLMKQAAPVAAAPAVTFTDNKGGQSFAERKAKGRVKIEAWVDKEVKDQLTELTTKLGLKFPKQTILRAIEELAAKYGM